MKKTTILLVAVIMASLPGCLDDVQETPLAVGGEGIAAPLNVMVNVGDGMVSLSWSPAPEASSYRVYRMVSTSEDWTRLATTEETSYEDAAVTNGRRYLYAIASLTAGGVESERSEPVGAVPSIYSLLIDGGAQVTGSRSVTLSLNAPATTALMRIGNSPDLSGSVWENFSTARQWLLETGDGQKTVYVQFQDESGAMSPTASGTVTLDTWAQIDSVVVMPVPAVYSPGETVAFRMRVEDDETEGVATVSVEGDPNAVPLRDDGRGGDGTPSDGVYEADYVFPASVRGTELSVTGRFVDRAGNRAQPLESGTKISFSDPPRAVVLVGAIDSTTSMITIRWEESAEENFVAYQIYRDTVPGIPEDPGPSLFIRGLDSRGQTTYPDTEVKEATTYYYRLFVLNDLEEKTPSNEIAASTVDAIPDPVVLDEPGAVGADRLTLTWSENRNTDFEEYRIYRSTSPGVTETSDLIVSITDREMTWFDDTGIDTSANTYYYRVLVFDSGGKSSRSNEVDSGS